MTDIVERLRQHAYPSDTALTDEAADEIERLRKALEIIAQWRPHKKSGLPERIAKEALGIDPKADAREALRHD